MHRISQNGNGRQGIRGCVRTQLVERLPGHGALEAMGVFDHAAAYSPISCDTEREQQGEGSRSTTGNAFAHHQIVGIGGEASTQCFPVAE